VAAASAGSLNLYFAAVLAGQRLQSRIEYVSDQAFTVGVTGFEPATSSSRSTVGTRRQPALSLKIVRGCVLAAARQRGRSHSVGHSPVDLRITSGPHRVYRGLHRRPGCAVGVTLTEP
jgi:hypothetical protein